MVSSSRSNLDSLAGRRADAGARLHWSLQKRQSNLDLPLEAVLEAVDYYQRHKRPDAVQ